MYAQYSFQDNNLYLLNIELTCNNNNNKPVVTVDTYVLDHAMEGSVLILVVGVV